MPFQTEEIVTSEYESKSQNTDNQRCSEDDSNVTESSDIISQFCLPSNYGTKQFSKRMVEEVNSNKPISIEDQTETMDLAIKAMVDIYACIHSLKLIEMSREYHSHKPQPTPDTKRKTTKTNTYKTNKQMHEKHTDQLPLP